MRNPSAIAVAAMLFVLPACDGLPDDPCNLLPPGIPCPDPDPDPSGPHNCDAMPAATTKAKYYRAAGSIDNKIVVVMRTPTDRSGASIRRLSASKASMEACVGRAFSVLDKAGIKGLRATEVEYFATVGTFSATIDMKKDGLQFIAAMVADPHVAIVSHEQTFTVSPKAGQTDTWGLDRIDQRELPLDGEYNPGDNRCGEDECRRHAATIDTGVTKHRDFSGRLIPPCATQHTFGGCDDRHGHGTHVTGTIGGLRWGVAEPWLHSSRVLGEDGSGTTSQVIAGIDAVIQWAADDGQVWVANMSLGGPPDVPLDEAVCNALAQDVVMVVAAGNDSGADPNTGSPARVLQALTIGATHRSDRAASFSNSGPGIDIWAPGQNITSTWNNGGTRTISGTSMAAPHVAGATILFLDRNPNATVEEVVEGVIEMSTLDVLSGVGDSPNRLLYVKQASLEQQLGDARRSMDILREDLE